MLRFEANGTALGTSQPNQPASELRVEKPGPVTIKADVAALLDPEPSDEGRAINKRRLDEKALLASGTLPH